MKIAINHKCCVSPNCELEIQSERRTAVSLDLFLSGELERVPPGAGMGSMG